MEQEKIEHTRESLSKHFRATKLNRVVFIKKDGSQRAMLYSLHPDLLPRVESSEGSEPTTKKAPAEHLFSVFDIEASGWRSFTIANIISLEAMS